MPTGYTQRLYGDEQTFGEFLTSCARATDIPWHGVVSTLPSHLAEVTP